ncbi:MAG: DUF1015 domain-containing protein [Methanomicrobiales archaeon]|nr:DUF1015 domain-containing protein [Methanomicrobiales archaeon]
MVHVYPFRAVRPAPGKAEDIAAVPYDVVNAEEAHDIISQNPQSFLKISRSDALLPGKDPYSREVYELSRSIFDKYRSEGLFIQDELPALYVYRVHDGDKTYTGIACCADTREYESGEIRRHELTRYDKEEDRTNHIDIINANTGPVVLLHGSHQEIKKIINDAIADRSPDMVVMAANKSRHEIFSITNQETIDRLCQIFVSIPALYIADGHHRCKSAVNVVEKRSRNGQNVVEETYHVLAVVFAEDEVKVHGYSRLLTDLSPLNADSLLKKISDIAHVTPYGEADKTQFCLLPKIGRKGDHIFHLYLKGMWYECVIPHNPKMSEIQSLDVSVFQEQVLIPFLNITDPRGDMRLQYLGGARPIRDLMAKVDGGEFSAAIVMQPVDVRTVFSIADAGGIMPPKSTWFEPKLLSGLLVHLLE